MKNYITLPDGRRKTCRIFDYGESVIDRYTAVYRAIRHKTQGLFWPYKAMNSAPFHPQGFGQHGELTQKPGRHLGKRIAFESLPEDCQKAIIQDLT